MGNIGRNRKLEEDDSMVGQTHFEVGDWLHCAATGHTAKVGRVDRVSACGEGGQYPQYVYMYLCKDANGATVYFGHISPLEKVEEPMTLPVIEPLIDPNEDTTSDPWNAPDALTTPAMADVVAEAKAETADVVQEADAAITALADEATEAGRTLQVAFDLLSEDETLMRALTAKRARALKLASTYRQRWQVACASAKAARHAKKTLQTTVAFQAKELADTKTDLVNAARRVTTLEAQVRLAEDRARNSRRLDTTPMKSGLVDQDAQADTVAMRDQVTAFMSVLREYGYTATTPDGARVDPAAWLKLRLANIGEPVQGTAKKAG